MDLFQSSNADIGEHIKHVFRSGELEQLTTVRKFRTVREEGNRVINRDLDHYNLKIILNLIQAVKKL